MPWLPGRKPSKIRTRQSIMLPDYRGMPSKRGHVESLAHSFAATPKWLRLPSHGYPVVKPRSHPSTTSSTIGPQSMPQRFNNGCRRSRTQFFERASTGSSGITRRHSDRLELPRPSRLKIELKLKLLSDTARHQCGTLLLLAEHLNCRQGVNVLRFEFEHFRDQPKCRFWLVAPLNNRGALEPWTNT
jgi:hypothetical protein